MIEMKIMRDVTIIGSQSKACLSSPTLVPIIPAFLYELNHQKDMVVLNETLRTSSPSPAQLYNRRLDERLSESANLLPYITSAKNMPLPTNRADKCDREEV